MDWSDGVERAYRARDRKSRRCVIPDIPNDDEINPRLATVEDARAAARRRLPRLVFDFVDGAVGRETAAEGNQAAFDRIRLRARVLVDVARRDLSRTCLGQRWRVPFGVAPMGMCNLVHPQADRLLAKAAAAHGMPLCISSAASSSIEDMGRLGGQNVWFQLYVGQHEQALAMIARARSSGYQNLVLTVDVPQLSRRARDLRNGFALPFRIGARQFLDFASHPRWSLRALVRGRPAPVNYANANGAGFDRNAARGGATWDSLARLRDEWPGRLIVKGVLDETDAQRIVSAGADGIWVSNHGGRQLDAAPAALDMLPRIRVAVGREFPLVFDSGVRSGEDILRARALGADLVMLGRPFLYALGADGKRGVATLIAMMKQEVDIALAQIGRRAMDEVGPDVLVDPPAVPDGLDTAATGMVEQEDLQLREA